MKRFEVYTLGCKVNFAESSARARALEADGWTRGEGSLDLIIVNTCSVTAAADKKCRNLIARLHRQHPEAQIVATGCYATRSPREVGSLSGVVRVESNLDKPLCAASLGDRTRSFLKVQDGCDYACSYCTIRSARGASRNPPIAEIVTRMRRLASEGVREVVLTGVNTGDFGRSTGETFIDLLRALDAAASPALGHPSRCFAPTVVRACFGGCDFLNKPSAFALFRSDCRDRLALRTPARGHLNFGPSGSAALIFILTSAIRAGLDGARFVENSRSLRSSARTIKRVRRMQKKETLRLLSHFHPHLGHSSGARWRSVRRKFGGRAGRNSRSENSAEMRSLVACSSLGMTRKIAADEASPSDLSGIPTKARAQTEQANPSLGIERFRISSIEPNLLTNEVIDFCTASPRFMPHFHIPLQSGCDRILALMRRRYTTAKFAERIARVREKMPDAFFGIDIIVGFPGETDDDFEQTYAFLEKIRPAELHVFPYSVRPLTPAATMPDRIPPAKIAERAKKLGGLSDRLHTEFREKFRGTRAKVLWEGRNAAGGNGIGESGYAEDRTSKPPRKMSGFTENYIRVEAPWDAAKVGTITETAIND